MRGKMLVINEPEGYADYSQNVSGWNYKNSRYSLFGYLQNTNNHKPC